MNIHMMRCRPVRLAFIRREPTAKDLYRLSCSYPAFVLTLVAMSTAGAQARGKVMFALDNEGAIRDRYLQNHPALKGRVMFATAPGFDHPAAAWFKINDPIGDFEKIQEAVRRGFLVRTRADADTVESRKNDPRRRDKAFASGAQFVSTDFAEARKEWSPYRVSFAKNVVARANPISLPNGSPDDLELLPNQKP